MLVRWRLARLAVLLPLAHGGSLARVKITTIAQTAYILLKQAKEEPVTECTCNR
jgi:hypothetical protein